MANICDSSANPIIALVSGMLATPAAAASLRRLPELRACDVLLCGSTASCRSSLALHFALHHVARTMLPAMFLCRQDSLEQCLPVLPNNTDDDDPNLHLLHIKYLSSHVDLQRFACCLHLLHGAYAAVVVEDISGLLRTDDRSALVRTLALLLDGVRAYRASSGRGSLCPLLVTDSSDEARRPRYIYDRWFPLTLTLSPAPPQTGPEGSFVLGVAQPPGSQSQPHGAMRMGIGPGGIEASQPQAPQAPPVGPFCVYRPAGSHLVLESVQGLGPPAAPAAPSDAGGEAVPLPPTYVTMGPVS